MQRDGHGRNAYRYPRSHKIKDSGIAANVTFFYYLYLNMDNFRPQLKKEVIKEWRTKFHEGHLLKVAWLP
jgi:hypothetical protein